MESQPKKGSCQVTLDLKQTATDPAEGNKVRRSLALSAVPLPYQRCCRKGSVKGVKRCYKEDRISKVFAALQRMPSHITIDYCVRFLFKVAAAIT